MNQKYTFFYGDNLLLLLLITMSLFFPKNGYAIMTNSVSSTEIHHSFAQQIGITDQSILSAKMIESYPKKAQESVQIYQKKLALWYTKNNSRTTVIPKLVYTGKIDLILTICFIFLTGWLVLRFFFNRSN